MKKPNTNLSLSLCVSSSLCCETEVDRSYTQVYICSFVFCFFRLKIRFVTFYVWVLAREEDVWKPFSKKKRERRMCSRSGFNNVISIKYWIRFLLWRLVWSFFESSSCSLMIFTVMMLTMNVAFFSLESRGWKREKKIPLELLQLSYVWIMCT